MALQTEHDRDKIDATVRKWRDECLLGDGSLLFTGADVWSDENLAELRRRFIDNPLTDKGRSFEDKFEEQLSGAPRGVVRLAAEAVLVYLLFVGWLIGPGAKRALVRRVLEFGEPPPDPIDDDLEPMGALGQAIGNPGVRYNYRRPYELMFQLELVEGLKALPEEERARLLRDDPWGLAEWVDALPDAASSQFRQVVLHLLYPNEFERIASGAHKVRIAQVFGGLLDNEIDNLDKQLLAIRERLEQVVPPGSRTHGGQLDFYWKPLSDAWLTGAPEDVRAVEHKGQLVFYGPPGTSKSYDAVQLGKTLIRAAALRVWKAPQYFAKLHEVEKIAEDNVHPLQLHPSSSYEGFIGGLQLTDGGGTTYVPGYLAKLVQGIDEEHDLLGDEALPHVLILDELNRADLSRVLGEAFSLLERDKRGKKIDLPETDPETGRAVTFHIPKNLYVIGTMNLIDQSVEQVDFALRRRFLWRELRFDRERLLAVLQERWDDASPKVAWVKVEPDMTRLADAAGRLNDKIAAVPVLGEQYEIGHTYFLDVVDLLNDRISSRRQRIFLWNTKGDPADALEDLWELALKPLLQEYFAGVESPTRTRYLEELQDTFMTAS